MPTQKVYSGLIEVDNPIFLDSCTSDTQCIDAENLDYCVNGACFSGNIFFLKNKSNIT